MHSNEQIIELTEFEKNRIKSLENDSVFGENLWNYYQFISWARWYPDLFVEIFKGKDSNRQLHFDQRVFMRCDLRFMSMYGTFSRGYAKCISGDSMIFTEDGIKEIGEYFNYNSSGVETHYDTKIKVVNRYGQLEKTKLGLYNGKQDTIKITTCDSFSIEGTGIHKVLVMNTNGQIQFKKLSEIAIGDYVIINRNNNVWGNKTHIDSKKLDVYISSLSKQKISHLYIRKMPSELTPEISLILGYLVGDGCLTQEKSIIFTNKDNTILDKYKKIMTDIFSVKNIRKTTDVDYVITDSYLKYFFNCLGLDNSLSYQKQIPKSILQTSKENAAMFLRGLFDTDGTVDDKVVSVCTVSEKLAKQVQFLLLNFGIISRVKRFNTKSKFGHCYKVIISGNDLSLFDKEIGFDVDYKRNKLNTIVNSKHNTNRDIIPYQANNAKDIYMSLKNLGKEYKFLYNVSHGHNNLSYGSLRKALQLSQNTTINVDEWNLLSDLNYYYSKVAKIDYGHTDVYDFHLPETHSFVSNGLVSHNTYTEVLDDFIAAILYPGITLSITAQTKENAAALLEDKFNEIMNDFPLMQNEVEKTRFSKGDAYIKWKNGSVITNLANAQTSKGRRRHRIKIEESALLNNTLFEDALEPIVEVPRTTVGSLAIVDPEEMNFQIHFFTTSGYRGSDEYNRSVRMVNGMRDCTGDIVLGSGWMLPCYYGRGSTKSQILKRKRRTNPIFFAQNYEQKWVGCSDGALVDINKLMATRVLERPIMEIEHESEEYYIGVDVARSENTNNNQSAISVIKVERNKNTKRILNIDVVNVLGMSNKLNFTEQACIIKKYKKAYKAKMVIVDGNGLGAGLVDELLKPSYDKVTGEYLGCFDTINTDNQPQGSNAEKILFDMKAQSYQTKVISHFINTVDSGLLRLLVRKQEQEFNDKEKEFFDRNIAPFVNTELLFFEIANLKLKVNGKTLSVEKVVRKIDKDKWSSLVYAIFYVMEFTNKDNEEEKFDFTSAPSCVSGINF